MQRYNNTVQTPTGQAVAGAHITVTVAANPAGSGAAATIFSDDGITSISNTVVADNLGRFGFYAPGGKYDLTIAGGVPAIQTPFVVSAVEIVDVLEYQSLDAQPITLQTLNFTEVTAGATPPTGTVNLYAKSDNNLYFKNSLGAETGPLGTAGGGGASPVGSVGDIQKNAGGGLLAASTINDNGSRVLVAEDVVFKGPNPWVDVRAYGARTVYNVPKVTLNTTSGLATVSVTSGGSSLLNGDGLAIPGAGATQTMTTPSAPTVTPSLASSSTGTGYTVPGAVGTTTYNYVIVGVDAACGFTSASAVATTVTGNSSLGKNTLAVSSATNLNGVVTWTVSSTANLATGTYFSVRGTGDDGEFGGFFRIASIVNGTQFTSNSGYDSRLGMSATSVSSGTITYWVCNHLVLPVPTDGQTYKYLIYGRLAGSYQLLYVTYPVNCPTLSSGDPVFMTWDDFGATMSNPVTPPWWAPTTPPAAPQNDMLVTTIVSGATTGTLTLATTALNSISGTVARFDCVPAIKAALAASQSFGTGGGGAVYFPAGVEDGLNDVYYNTSSPLTFSGPGSIAVFQAAPITFGETVTFSGQWLGCQNDPLRNGVPQFALSSNPTIATQTSPGFVIPGGATFKNITFQPNGNAYIGMFHVGNGTHLGDNPPNPVVFDNVAMSSQSTPANDYMGILFYSYSYFGNSGFGGQFKNTTWNTGPTQSEGSTSTPLFIAKYNPGWQINYTWGSRRGFYFTAPGGTVVNRHYCQANIMPLYTVNRDAGGSVGGDIVLNDVILDTAADPLIVFHSTASGSIGATLEIWGGNAPSSGMPLVSGDPFNPVLLVGGAAVIPVSQTGRNIKISCLNANPANLLTGSTTLPSLYLSQSIAAPASSYGTTFYNLASDDAPAFSNNNSASKYFLVGSSTNWLSGSGTTLTGTVTIGSTTFASLGSPPNGSLVYCSDCTIANPCAGSGTGALAKRLNSVWVCS